MCRTEDAREVLVKDEGGEEEEEEVRDEEAGGLLSHRHPKH